MWRELSCLASKANALVPLSPMPPESGHHPLHRLKDHIFVEAQLCLLPMTWAALGIRRTAERQGMFEGTHFQPLLLTGYAWCRNKKGLASSGNRQRRAAERHVQLAAAEQTYALQGHLRVIWWCLKSTPVVNLT